MKFRPKHILFIAHFFPPLGGAGVQRPLKFAKYLPLFGWRPIVLTVKNPDWHYAHDPELLKELPSEVQIKRSFMIRSAWFYRFLNPMRSKRLDEILSHFLIQPDNQIGWIPFAYLTALNIIKKNAVKAIFSTSGPYSSHLVGYLVKRKTGIPWVADFRDEWYETPTLKFPTRFHRQYHYNLEKIVVQSADKITTTSPAFGKMLAKHCENSNKFSTITNGFDLADLKIHNRKNQNIKRKSKFVISFIGLFHGATNPDKFLKSLQELIEEGKIPPDNIKVQFVGANTSKQIDFNDQYKICSFTGYVSHKQALTCLYEADALLLILSESRGKGVIPGKTFEYIASGKSILALVPKVGETAKIINETNTGIVVDPEDSKEIKKAILKLFNEFKKKKNNVQLNWKQLAKYERKELTKNLSIILDDVIR